MSKGHVGRRDGELCGAVTATGLFGAVEIESRIEVDHPSFAHRGGAAEPLPEGFHACTAGGDHPEAGDGHPAVGH